MNYCANHDAAEKKLQCRNKAVPGHIYCDRCRAEGGGYVKALIPTANKTTLPSLHIPQPTA